MVDLKNEKKLWQNVYKDNMNFLKFTTLQQILVNISHGKWNYICHVKRKLLDVRYFHILMRLWRLKNITVWKFVRCFPAIENLLQVQINKKNSGTNRYFTILSLYESLIQYRR